MQEFEQMFIIIIIIMCNLTGKTLCYDHFKLGLSRNAGFIESIILAFCYSFLYFSFEIQILLLLTAFGAWLHLMSFTF